MTDELDLDPKVISELNERIEESNKKLDPFHKEDVGLVAMYTGSHYGGASEKGARPLNLTELGVNTLLRAVTSQNTRTMVDSKQEELLPGALDLQEVLNNELERMDFDDACNDVALGAMFRMGIMEVGITTKDTPPDGKGNLHDPGHPFADNVPFTETILDMRAKRPEQLRFIGHEYVVPYDWVKSNSSFINVDQIKSPENTATNDGTRLQEISGTGGDATRSEHDDTIVLRQVFRPREKDILTLVKGYDNLAIQRIPWLGPEKGPYHMLSFGKVPGNLIGLAPVPQWHDLDDIANKLFCQVADQAERQKTILGVPTNSIDDGKKVVAAKDGDAVPMDNPKNCQEFSFGGANQETLALIIWIKQLWDYMAGNITALGGLGAMSRTGVQDQLIASASGGRTEDMQTRMMAFKTDVVRDIAFWIWNDPVSEYRIAKPVGTTGYTLPTTWTPESRMGGFLDYNIKLNLFAENNKTPQEKANEFLKFIIEIFPTLMPLMQQQGISLDAEAIIKMIARYMNMEEIGRTVIYTRGEQLSPEGTSDQFQMPQNSTRKYIRENRPSASMVGNEQTMMATLMGGNPQQSQMAALTRNAG